MKLFQFDDIEPDDTVSALVNRAVGQMSMPPTDVAGRPLVYHARLDRVGRQLYSSERIGDAILTNDRLTMFPSIDAASPRVRP